MNVKKINDAQNREKILRLDFVSLPIMITHGIIGCFIEKMIDFSTITI